MAKRELSSTLKNLKFMQRAREKDEIAMKEEKEHKTISPISGNKKCVVIMEGDPMPEAVSGRMSFQNFNPCVDKLNEEYNETHKKHRLYTTSSADRSEMNINREHEANWNVNDNLNKNQENDGSEDLQRKKLKVEEDGQGLYSSPRNSVGHNGSHSSLGRGGKNSQERGKLDWKLLRPPTGRSKRS